MITVDFKRIPTGAAYTLLDIGCGSGRHSAAAFDRMYGLVVGADQNDKDLDQAQSRLRFHQSLKPNGRWAFTGADITDLPFSSHCFDVVICSEVLEHIHNDTRAIRETVRVLKSGGHLVVSVPRRWPETICWLLSRAYRRSKGGHIRIYRRRDLVHSIQACGMQYDGGHFAHSLHSPFWWLKCLLGPHRDELWPVRQYHRFLTWEMMKQPRATRCVERWLNPAMGKSLVLYFHKP